MFGFVPKGPIQKVSRNHYPTQVNYALFQLQVRDGVMVMCNGNALQCITIFKVMGSNV